jgi:hypothetical protein
MFMLDVIRPDMRFKVRLVGTDMERDSNSYNTAGRFVAALSAHPLTWRNSRVASTDIRRRAGHVSSCQSCRPYWAEYGIDVTNPAATRQPPAFLPRSLWPSPERTGERETKLRKAPAGRSKVSAVPIAAPLISVYAMEPRNTDCVGATNARIAASAVKMTGRAR